MGYIYLVTNTVNGKRYVGQTRQKDIERRWQQHRRISKSNLGPHLYNAYLLHGIHAFKFQIICICFDEDCDKFESEYIARYNTLSPNGYNIKSGGNSSSPSQETREKIRIANTKNMTPERREHLRTLFTGRKIQESQKSQISASLKKYWASLTPEESLKISNERKNRKYIRRNIKYNIKPGAYNYCKKAVAKYSKDGSLLAEYESIKSAAENNGLDFRQISKVCARPDKFKTTAGFVWKFIETKESS
jgi:group I intron endonuclease